MLPTLLDKSHKFDYTTNRKALCPQTASSLHDQKEIDRSGVLSLRRSILFSICIPMLCDLPGDIKGIVDNRGNQRQQADDDRHQGKNLSQCHATSLLPHKPREGNFKKSPPGTCWVKQVRRVRSKPPAFRHSVFHPAIAGIAYRIS